MSKSILVFEWMVGGGYYFEPLNATDSRLETAEIQLQTEGAAMLRGLVDDLLHCGHHPVVSIDSRLQIHDFSDATCVSISNKTELEQALAELASQVDGVFLIAPESNGRLVRLVSHLAKFAHKLLSPNLAFVEMTSDKTATLARLGASGLKTPIGDRLDRWQTKASLATFPLPAMLKPNDGVGGEGNRRITDWDSLPIPIVSPDRWRLEEWVEGQPASISVICGHESCEKFFLPPTFQIFQNGHWIDCEIVLSPEKTFRATELAKKTIKALPVTNGFIGIDFVFGPQAVDDTVIEVNPRLTSSYLRLRNSVNFNIAEKIIEVCQ